MSQFRFFANHFSVKKVMGGKVCVYLKQLVAKKCKK